MAKGRKNTITLKRKGSWTMTNIVVVIVLIILLATILFSMYGGKKGMLRKVADVAKDYADEVLGKYHDDKEEVPLTAGEKSLNNFQSFYKYLSEPVDKERCYYSFKIITEEDHAIIMGNNDDGISMSLIGKNGIRYKQEEIKGVKLCAVLPANSRNFYRNNIEKRCTNDCPVDYSATYETILSGFDSEQIDFFIAKQKPKKSGAIVVSAGLLGEKETTPLGYDPFQQDMEDADSFYLYQVDKNNICLITTKEGDPFGFCDGDDGLDDDCLEEIPKRMQKC